MTKKPSTNGSTHQRAASDGGAAILDELAEEPVADAAQAKPNRRRATAESMAAGQRDISVSEFFAKNRHLLGFDNPRKALLTTIKEAVDNSLDACEEAGILPEIWVHVEATGTNRYKIGVQDNGPGIVKAQIPKIFGKLLYGSKFHRLRMSRGQQGIGISAAGMYGVLTTGKPVKIISRYQPRKPAHYFEIQIDTKKNNAEILNGRGEGIDIPPGDAGRQADRKAGHRVARRRSRHARDDRAGGQIPARPRQRRRISGANGDRQSARHAALQRPRRPRARISAPAEVLPPEPKEIKPHPYGVELGMLMTLLKAAKPTTLAQFLTENFSRVSSPVARKICEGGQAQHSGQHHQDRPARSRRAVPRDSKHQDRPAGHRLHLADRRAIAAQGIAPGGSGRVLRGRHAPAERVSRQSVSRSKSAWPTADVSAATARHARRPWAKCLPRATPARCGSF